MLRTAAAQSLRDALRGSAPTDIEAFAARLSATEAAFLAQDWQLWARDDQLPPATAQAAVRGPHG